MYGMTGTFDVQRPAANIALVTFRRPRTLNSMTLEFVRDLTEALRDMSKDDSIRVVILTGEGRGFSSGHDLGDFRQDPDAEPPSIPNFYDHQDAFARLTSQIVGMPQPVIAAVNGPATGGGLAMALAADTRVCSESARFSAAFIRLGISGCDVGVSYLLPRIVGPTLAFEMMLTGRLVEADEARHCGLVLDVVPDGDVVERAMRIAEQICRNAPFAVLMTKRALWPGFNAPSLDSAIELENRTQILCGLMDDAAEAAGAFITKRDPKFRNS
jgi:enoyl-CoA hydratase